MNNNDIEYTEKTITYTYMYLYKTALMNLEELSKSKKGEFYRVITIIIFVSFTIESYMNHIGNKICDFWNKIERNRPLEKLEILYSLLKIEYDKSKRPIQSIIDIFDIRNKFAHAKTEVNEESYFDVNQNNKNNKDIFDKENIRHVKPKWEEKITKKNAQIYFEDMRKILKLLHSKTDSNYQSPFNEIFSRIIEEKNFNNT